MWLYRVDASAQASTNGLVRETLLRGQRARHPIVHARSAGPDGGR